MTGCAIFSQSIKPKSLLLFEEDLTIFQHMMQCFEIDSKKFQNSRSLQDTRFTNRFMSVTRPRLQQGESFAKYRRKVLRHLKLCDKHVDTLQYGSLALMQSLMHQMKDIFQQASHDLGYDTTLPLTPQRYASLSLKEQRIVDTAQAKLESLNAKFLASLLASIGLSFFAFESACRVCCSLVCQAFAGKVAECQVAHHRDVWKTLKRLAGLERSSLDCSNCSSAPACQFHTDFAALARIYSYVIKVRMLADYREFFYIASTLWQYMAHTYIPHIIGIIKSQKALTSDCLL